MTGSEEPRDLYLTPAVEAELQWLAAEGPPVLARHARIVLGFAKGMTLRMVAETVGVHPNTVRNCLRRFEVQGLKGLAHRGTGKSKNVAFTESVRDEVARVAMHSPRTAGEPIDHWSLRSLRTHLIGRGVIQEISVEGLRQLLRGLPLPAAYWRRTVRPANALQPEVRHALESMRDRAAGDRRVRAQIVLAHSQGLNEAEITAALHVGRATVRRWLRRFRRAGILGLETLPRTTPIRAKTRQEIVLIASTPPRQYGLDRDQWTLPGLRRVLVRTRVVPAISLAQLGRLVRDKTQTRLAAVPFAESERSTAVG